MRSEDLREDLQGNVEKSQPTKKQKMTQKPAMTFDQWKGMSFTVITSNVEFLLCVPKEGTFSILLK